MEQTSPDIWRSPGDFVAKARSGETKISNCKNEGAKVVDGVDTVQTSYRYKNVVAPAVK